MIDVTRKTPIWPTLLWIAGWLLQTISVSLILWSVILASNEYVQEVALGVVGRDPGLHPVHHFDLYSLVYWQFRMLTFGVICLLNINVSLFAFYSLAVRKPLRGAIIMTSAAILTLVAYIWLSPNTVVGLSACVSNLRSIVR